MGDITEHFSRKEFACRCGCGYDAIDETLVRKLEAARMLVGRAIHVNSGCRCKAHNDSGEVAGALNSAHLTGLAADLACPSSYDRYDLLMALLTVGFHRLGIGRDFLHVDIDRTKPTDLCWLY